MKKLIFTLVAGILCVLSMETLSAQTARLQVIHNSPSPTVDVYLNGGATPLIDDFEYRKATPFIDAPAGVPLTIGIALGNSTSPNDVIANFEVTLDENGTYVAVANGIVGNADTPFGLVINDMGQEMGTGDNVDFAVLHGSTDAPAVDVIARGVGTLVDNAAFGDFTAYLSVPAAKYLLDITPAEDNGTIVATYEADLSGLAGGAAVVFASGFLSGDDPAFGLFAALPTGDVIALPSTSLARLQVIHNSASPTVDIYLGETLLLDNFAYRTATPFIDAPAGEEITIGVALDNSTSSADAVATFNLTLENGKTYVAVANGLVGNADTPFGLVINDMGQEMGTGDNVDFAVLHGSTDAPAVDVIARGVGTLVDNAAFGDFTAYLSVPAAKYLLDITPAEDNGTIVATYEADLSGLAGGAAVVFASGFLSGDDPAFGLFAALPTGDVIALPSTSLARLQVIHNSASPTVDIYLGETLLLDNFAYRTATPFIDAPAGEEITIGVALDNSTSSADAVATFNLTLENGKTYVAVANGLVGNADTPFGLVINDMGQEMGTGDNVDFAVLHGSTDAPAVDVIARGVGTLVDNAAFGDFTAYLSVPAAKYLLDITPAEDNGTIVATYEADLSGLAGGAAVVFASGFLSGDDPAFGLFAALPTGDVIALPSTSLARLQVIHNSASPTVDIYLGETLLLDNFAYRTATPFIDAPAGEEITIGVALDNSTSSADAVATFNLTLENGKRYVAVANGLVGNADTPFGLVINDMGQELGTGDNVDFAVLHGSTDAPAVDVIARGVGTLVDNAAFGDFTAYLSVPAAKYLLDITPAEDNGTIVATYEADLSGLAGGAAVVFASGFLSGDDPAFGLFAALPTGDVIALPSTSLARLQVIHNSASPTVDIYLGETLLLDNFAYRTATPFIDAPAGEEITIGVALDNSTSSADAVATFNLTLENGNTYVAIAGGVVGDQNAPFTLYVRDMAREKAMNADDVDVLFFHGATDAPTVDVLQAGTGVVVDNASFGDFAGYINPTVGAVTLQVTPAEDNATVVASYDVDFAPLAGQAITVFASGFFSGDAPAFDVWAADANGNTFSLSGTTSIGGNLNIDQELMTIFPNPAYQNVNVKYNLKETGKVNFSLFDAIGRRVENVNFERLAKGEHQFQLPISRLERGVYTLVMTTENMRSSKKVLINK